MVNGIVASPFAMNHMLANMFYNVHRALYAVSPGILGIPSLRRLNEVSLIWSGRVSVSCMSMTMSMLTPTCVGWLRKCFTIQCVRFDC